jgi:hypothetical protein
VDAGALLVPEPILVAAAGLVGLLAFSLGRT